MDDFIHDIIVVGSGMSGAQAAHTLVESGMKVCMLDVGFKDDYYKNITPKESFHSIRYGNDNQHEIFLGKNLESVQRGGIKIGAQLTPSRFHLIKDIDKYLPIKSNNFFPYQSLAYGGLGAGWGAGAFAYSNAEISAMGLDKNELNDAYNVVSNRIGISGARDDGSIFCNEKICKIQSPVKLDENNSAIFQRYLQRKSRINSMNTFMGRSNLAVITEDYMGRKKLDDREMSFYDDFGESVYRPWITINQLLKKENFLYKSGYLVTHFLEKPEYILVHVLSVGDNIKTTFKCKKLVLGAGIMSTARIALRSFSSWDKLPIICNPYSYLSAIDIRHFGKPFEKNKNGLSQLFMFYDKFRNNMDVSTCSFYSYSSLLAFRIIKTMPLNMRDSRILMRYLMPALTIVGIHHPEKGSNTKFLLLEKDESKLTGDVINVNYELSNAELNENASREIVLIRAIKRLGLQPLKKISTDMGGSIHYCGTMPFSTTGERFTLSKSGKLSGTENIYVADGSGFKYLPAKGISLTLMANAHLVAKTIINGL
jgi:hypothetical protein